MTPVVDPVPYNDAPKDRDTRQGYYEYVITYTGGVGEGSGKRMIFSRSPGYRGGITVQVRDRRNCTIHQFELLHSDAHGLADFLSEVIDIDFWG